MNFLAVDDHSIIVAGLRTFIESMIDNAVVDSAADAVTALEKVQDNDYDLVILDAHTLSPDPFGAVKNMLALKPELKILVFTVHPEAIHAKKYLLLGAQGFLSKDASEEEIKNAIRDILDNKKYISAALMEVLARDALGNKSLNPFDSLSPKEFEIVKHLIRGESVSEISQKLNLHKSTIGTHKARIFTKLDCSNIISLSELAKINNIY